MLKEKFIHKYMRLAHQIAIDNDVCFSRKIGVVIVKETINSSRIVGSGYNGPPPGTPHTDSPEYLEHYFWPMLTDDEKTSIRHSLAELPITIIDNDDPKVIASVVLQYANRKICPRRLIGAKSGEHSELCSCGHAERHAITNAACDLDNCIMFCWCGVPCLQCSDAIIHSGIREIHCIREPVDYHQSSRWLLITGGVTIYEYDASIFA